jgi:hypothetical protein
MTVEIDGEKFHLGYSRASKYLECPAAYKKTYIDKIRTAGGVPLRRGHAYHGVLEGLLNYKINRGGEHYPLDKTEKFALKQALKHNLSDTECARVIQAARFYHARMYPLHNPLAVELKFDFYKDGIRYTGRLDLLDRREAKGQPVAVIIDHKFSYDTWAESRAKIGVQPIVYQWAWEEQLHKEFDGLDYGGFAYNIIRLFPTPVIQEIRVKPCNQTASDWWSTQLRDIARGIHHGVFYADPGEKKCQYCDHKKLCKPTIYTIKEVRIGDTNADED